MSNPVRDVRYCELLPVTLTLRGPHAVVYNTLGHSDCPQAEWSALTENEARKVLGGFRVVLNGPRYFVMDRIIGSGSTIAGDTVTVGGITLARRASLYLPWTSLKGSPYRPLKVERETVYRYEAGKPVFELTGPDGSVYRMQSYSLIVDKDLTYKALPDLGKKLKLPPGWSFATRVPDKDDLLTAGGEATVVQDDLDNTYQKVTTPTQPQ